MLVFQIQRCTGSVVITRFVVQLEEYTIKLSDGSLSLLPSLSHFLFKHGCNYFYRGKYRPPNAPPDGEKPLYLHISAGAHVSMLD